MDLLRVIERKPDIPAGYLVLQDLPDVVANAKLSEKIELMPYDFFTEREYSFVRMTQGLP